MKERRGCPQHPVVNQSNAHFPEGAAGEDRHVGKAGPWEGAEAPKAHPVSGR